MSARRSLGELIQEEVTQVSDCKRMLSEEFRRHQRELNQAFLQHLKSSDQLAMQVPAAEDYEFYSSAIANRFAHGVRGTGVMSFGTGDCGQLGHGISDPPKDSETTVPLPRRLAFFPKGETDDIRILASGGLSNGVVNSKGLFTWGCNDGNALGRDGDENLPTLVHFPLRIIITSLALGDSHGACVSLGGQGFLWGSYRDKEGKAWFPDFEPPQPGKSFSGPDSSAKSPQLIPSLSNLTKVCSGATHTVFLDGAGQVYTCGLGEQYQLARPVTAELKDAEQEYVLERIHLEHLRPQRVPLDNFFCIQIGCGQYHTLLVSQEFAVYGCGLNQYRQVCPLEESMVRTLTRITSLDGKQITEVGGGEHFSFASSARNGMYTWGRADQNQLGRAVSSSDAGACEEEPKPVQGGLPKDLRQISCGSSHVIVCSKQGKVYTWGFGESYQLGHGESEDEPLPKQVANLDAHRVIQVSAGGQHCCVLLEDE